MKKTFIIAIIVILIATAAGASYFFTAKFFKKQQGCGVSQSNQNNIQNLPAEIRIAGGVVEKVEGDIIFLHFSRQGADKIYKVKVGPETKLVKLDYNDPNNAPSFGKDAPDLPEISLSDIKKDNFVSALASEDIKDKTEFTAKTVTLQIPGGVKAK